MSHFELIDIKSVKQDVTQFIIDNHSEQLQIAVEVIEEWLDKEEWESKNIRKEYIRQLDIHKLVLKVLSNLALVKPMPLASFAGSLTLHKGMSEQQNITTAIEILVVLTKSNLVGIVKNQDSYDTWFRPILSQELQDRIRLSCYVPPKHEPVKVVNNIGIICGNHYNQHDKYLSYDVLNTLNSTALEVDTWFIDNHDKPLPNEDEYWDKYLEEFNTLYELIKDKPLHFEYRYDKRGRVYSSGYHFNPQGSSFEKASLSLVNKELVTGEL